LLKRKSLILVLGLVLVALLAACGGGDDEEEQATEDTTEETTDTATSNVGEAVDYTIVGIEPGAGIMELTANALEEYENLEGWELLEGSTAGMLVELDGAIQNEEPVVVTGWGPHWMFVTHDLKYLEDTKGTYGEPEGIHTIAREGLEEDMPEAYEILDNFYWEIEDMEGIMFEAEEGGSFEEAAQNWIDENRDKVDEWTDGVDEVDGESIELVTTQWDSEYASSEVMRIVLEEHGFDVTVTPVDPAIVFQAIASGEGDASLAPWLPITHGHFFEEYEDEIVHLGENLFGAQVGLAVPSYMDIDSIEELEPRE